MFHSDTVFSFFIIEAKLVRRAVGLNDIDPTKRSIHK